MSRTTLIYLISIWPRRAWIQQLLRQLRPVSDAAKVHVLPVSQDDGIYHLKASELRSYNISDLPSLIRRFCSQRLPSEKRMVRVLDAGKSRGHVVGEGEVLEFELKKKTQKAAVVEVVSQTLHIVSTEPGFFKAGLCCSNIAGPPIMNGADDTPIFRITLRYEARGEA